jgi:hypothetical protein
MVCTFVYEIIKERLKNRIMKKKFVIQNAIDKKYWYGFYTNKNWTNDILEARLFENKQEMEDWIENNIGELEGMFLVAIEVWS